MKRLDSIFAIVLALCVVVAAGLYAHVAVASDAGPTAAPAAPQASPVFVPPDFGSDPSAFAGATLDAVKAGKWIVAAGLVILAGVWLARRYIGEVFPWLQTDRGGVVLTLATAFLAQLSTSMVSEVPFSGSMFLAALAAAWTASGGFSQIKRLIKPPDRAAAAEQAKKL